MEEQGQTSTLSDFLDEIALSADIDSVDPDQDYVLLMTLGQKGGRSNEKPARRFLSIMN